MPDVSRNARHQGGVRCQECNRVMPGVMGYGWQATSGQLFCNDCWRSWGVEKDPHRLAALNEWTKPMEASEKEGTAQTWEEEKDWGWPKVAPDVSKHWPLETSAFCYCDAHCHLDYVLQNQKHGYMTWQTKTKLCQWWRYEKRCPWKSCCDYAHGQDELVERSPLEDADIETFALRNIIAPFDDAVRKTRMRYPLGFVITSLCEVESIRDTQKIIATASNNLLDGKVFCTVGCHPQNYREYDDEYEARLLQALDALGDKVVAWGECGLDYAKSWDVEFDNLRVQMVEAFVRQIKMAVSRKLPLVVHAREADEDTKRALTENVPTEQPVHIHAYQGSLEFMHWCLKALPNSIFGTSSLIFCPENNAIDIVRECPLDRLVLETDAPYLEEEPRDLIEVAAKVAEIKNISIGRVLEVTSAACKRFYKIEGSEDKQHRDVKTEDGVAGEKFRSWHAAVDWDRDSRMRRRANDA